VSRIGDSRVLRGVGNGPAIREGNCAHSDEELFEYFLLLSEGLQHAGMAQRVESCGRCRARLGRYQLLAKSVRRPSRTRTKTNPAPPINLDGLELCEMLGKGGMGAVWRAYDKELKRFLAVKVMRTSLLECDEMRERFVREAQVSARLSHPNIVHVYYMRRMRDWAYIAMELVDGVVLSDCVRRHSLSIDDSVRVLREILEGLQAAHRAHIVHRDIKPSNIILDAQGHVRILDFGLAKIISDPESKSLTLPGILMGTPEYLPPEALLGEAATVQWDLYSTGIVAYELLTGATPLSDPFPDLGKKKDGLGLTGLKCRMLLPSKRNISLPPWLEMFVQKLCAPRAERYKDAMAALADLTICIDLRKSIEKRNNDDARAVPTADSEIEFEEIDAPLSSIGSISLPTTVDDFADLVIQFPSPAPSIQQAHRQKPEYSRPVCETLLRVASWVRSVWRRSISLLKSWS